MNVNNASHFPSFLLFITAWIRNHLNTRVYWRNLQSSNEKSPLNLLTDCQTRFFSSWMLMERALKLKSEIEAICRKFSQEEQNPMSLTIGEWKLVEQVVELIRPFQLAAKLLEKHSTASGVMVTQIISQLLITTRTMLPESSKNDELSSISEQISDDHPWKKLKEEICQGRNSEELFMMVRYLWSGMFMNENINSSLMSTFVTNSLFSFQQVYLFAFYVE